jgi:putative membrane protein
MVVNIRKTMSWAAIVGVFALGCADAETEDEGAVQDTAAQTAPAATGGPSDAEIAHIVVTANTIDVDAGRLAKEKSQNQQVITFADRMITDHTAVNEQASQLAGRLNLTPADNSTSQSLKTSADQTLERLRAATGAEFDRAYADNEVAFHQQVLDAIDSTLIPNAQNADLKALLQQTRPAIAAHLEMARSLQSSLQ